MVLQLELPALISFISLVIGAIFAGYKMSCKYTDKMIFGNQEIVNEKFLSNDRRFDEIKEGYGQRIDDLKEDIVEMRKELHQLRSESTRQSERIIELITNQK